MPEPHEQNSRARKSRRKQCAFWRIDVATADCEIKRKIP